MPKTLVKFCSTSIKKIFPSDNLDNSGFSRNSPLGEAKQNLMVVDEDKNSLNSYILGQVQ